MRLTKEQAEQNRHLIVENCIADVQIARHGKCRRRRHHEGIRLYTWRILQPL